MDRIRIKPRVSWKAKVESQGFYFHENYWDESAYYRFNHRQIDLLEAVTQKLHELSLQAVQYVIDHHGFAKLHIPEYYVPLIQKFWDNKEPALYGRLDLSYNGKNSPKLLEYNADTPTSVIESSVVQWFWLQDCFPEADQFNSIHEKLLDFWQSHSFREPLYFTCVRDSVEDLGNVEYLRDTATTAGYQTKQIFIEELGWVETGNIFVDLENQPITTLFKLYPWEWMFADEFGKHLLNCDWSVIEPAWKIILSNKGILPLLWQLFPHHPNLLPAYFEEGPLRQQNYVKKPFFSKRGKISVFIERVTWSSKPKVITAAKVSFIKNIARYPNSMTITPLLVHG